jgi:hypothetical protein
MRSWGDGAGEHRPHEANSRRRAAVGTCASLRVDAMHCTRRRQMVGPGNPPPHRPFDDRIQETYSHIAAEVGTHLLEGLQDRWLKPSPTARCSPRGGDPDLTIDRHVTAGSPWAARLVVALDRTSRAGRRCPTRTPRLSTVRVRNRAAGRGDARCRPTCVQVGADPVRRFDAIPGHLVTLSDVENSVRCCECARNRRRRSSSCCGPVPGLRRGASRRDRRPRRARAAPGARGSRPPTPAPTPTSYRHGGGSLVIHAEVGACASARRAYSGSSSRPRRWIRPRFSE